MTWPSQRRETRQLFVYDRLLEHHPDPDAIPRGGSRRRCAAAGRLVHRLCLPLAIATDVPALAENPFRAPEEVYTLLTQTGHQLRWIEHVRAITPTPADHSPSLYRYRPAPGRAGGDPPVR